MLFSACNKEEEIPLVSTNNVQIENRSDLRPCGLEFISNGGFESYNSSCLQSGGSLGPNGTFAFSQSCVDDWQCYLQTPDLILPTWNFGTGNISHWNNYSFQSNWAFMCTSDGVSISNDAHGEAIFQQLALPNLPDLRFCLSFDYSKTNSSQSSLEDLPMILDVNIGLFNTSPGCSNVDINNGLSWSIDMPGSLYNPTVNSFTAFFPAGTPLNGISFKTRTEANIQNNNSTSQPHGGFVDNISITCSSAAVNGIDFINNGNCKFDFSLNTDPNFGGTAAINWNFGDSNTGGGENPSHQYANTGMYTVTATVLDNQGCCTTVTRIIDCNSSLACDYFICWATNYGDPNENSMQGFEEVVGFTVIDPASGNSVDHFFSQPYDIVGNFQNIFNEFKSILVTQYNINPNNVISADPALGCLKGNSVMPVFLVENSPVVISGFFGTDLNGTISPPFEPYNCN